MTTLVSYSPNSVKASTSVSAGAAVAGFGRVLASGASGALTGGPVGAGVSALGQALSEIPGGSGAGAVDPSLISLKQENHRLLQLQMNVSQETNKFSAISNTQKADHEARANTIRNFR